jgi:chorismate dehydratase
MSKIRISNISYLNTLPFRYGLASYKFPEKYSVIISEDFPSECARKLASNECEIGIVPVAVTSGLKEYKVTSDYCIASLKEVRSVMLFSECPLSEITSVYMDYQSRTSVKLLKYLSAEKWHRTFQWIEAKPGYEKQISGKTAGLVIGDRALSLYDKFPYQYDLATEWNELTGLPFVFATWVAHKSVPDEFLTHFNNALKTGIENIQIAAGSVKNKYPYDIMSYLTNNIYYHYDENCRRAMNFFLNTSIY